MTEGFDPAAEGRFWAFVCERQRIWRKRFVELLPPPWTDDPVLREWRFTNVYRDLDAGTAYCRAKILRHAGASFEDRAFNVMVLRLVGRWQTHEALGFRTAASFRAPQFALLAKELRERGEPVYTGSYQVSSYGRGSMDENVGLVLEALALQFGDLWALLRKCETPERAFELLRSMRGYGEFLAYQCLVDMTMPFNTAAEADDSAKLLGLSLADWVVAGPGARRGLAAMGWARDPLDGMRALRDRQVPETVDRGLQFDWLEDTAGAVIPLSLVDIEHSLCEFARYVAGRTRLRFGR